jgi:hypothetical protein
MNLRKSATIGVSAIALLLGLAYSAEANPLLPVQNLTFSQFGPGGLAPKAIFSTTNVLDWTGGTGLISIDAPGTATQTGAGGDAYPVYGPFANPPPGGNFIQADGNPTFETTFQQTLTGLTTGQTYTLSFWQAAGQQTGFTGATTEQWKIFLGKTGSINVNCSSNPCTVTSPDAEYDTSIMDTPSMGVFPWEEVSVNVVATAATNVLSFLAWGDGGNTTNLPPTVFLAGVNSPAVPEPATWSLFGVGLLGLGGIMLHRRARRNVAV